MPRLVAFFMGFSYPKGHAEGQRPLSGSLRAAPSDKTCYLNLPFLADAHIARLVQRAGVFHQRDIAAVAQRDAVAAHNLGARVLQPDVAAFNAVGLKSWRVCAQREYRAQHRQPLNAHLRCDALAADLFGTACAPVQRDVDVVGRQKAAHLERARRLKAVGREIALHMHRTGNLHGCGTQRLRRVRRARNRQCVALYIIFEVTRTAHLQITGFQRAVNARLAVDDELAAIDCASAHRRCR